MDNVQVPSKIDLSTYKMDLLKSEPDNVDTEIHIELILVPTRQNLLSFCPICVHISKFRWSRDIPP